MKSTPHLRLRTVYKYASDYVLKQEVRAIKDMTIRSDPKNWTLTKTSSVRRGFIIELFKRKDKFREFKEQHWKALSTAPQ